MAGGGSKVLGVWGILNCEDISNTRKYYKKFSIIGRCTFQEKTSYSLWNHLFFSEGLSIWHGEKGTGLII